MSRRSFVSSSVLVFLAAPLGAKAQPSGRIYRIGHIAPDAGPSLLTEAFRQGLRDLGYTEGQNLAIEYRWLGSRPERLPEMAAELVSLRPDLIVAISHRVAMAVKKATTTIPIAFAHVNDPVGVGLVRSLSHPGGNITGLSTQGLDLIAKRLELLKELLRSESRFAYVGNPDEPYSPVYVREAQRAARALGIKEVLSVEVRGPSDFDAAFALITVRRPNALLIEPNSLNWAHRLRVTEFAVANRLPTIYGSRDFVDSGGLMSYGLPLPAHYQRLAFYVDKILKGVKPADLPVEQPTQFELVINLKTAKALGLTISQTLLLQASQVIE
jgi:putative ABC transport system substrate-binding protein